MIWEGDKIKLSGQTLKKDQWPRTIDCVICKIKFNKLAGVFSHHCRVCYERVCSDCSKSKDNKMNDKN
jgi:hypothetical protein